MQTQTPNPAQQALLQFMQGSSTNTAPLIQPTVQSSVSKPGRALTWRNLLGDHVGLLKAPAEIAKGNAGESFKRQSGWDALNRAFGGATVTAGPKPLTVQAAPQLYWGGLLNSQSQKL